MSAEDLLHGLNRSQRDAVSSPAQTLAILAGPGSGKTHTLTSRTAWLLHKGLHPSNIIVATFTVKAAAEMKERIGKLLGNGLESKLILGTFHSIAARYLRRYGNLIGLEKGFAIADTTDSAAIIRRIVKRHNLNIDPKIARARISKRKAKGDAKEAKPAAKTVDSQEFETCFNEYEETLQRTKQLDFDDLLLRCVELLRNFPACVANVEAVLIDEFQDTNLVQFDLMRLFASARKRVTIVGDPDQSIYGFRSAETKNFHRMLRQYPETVTIPLEENYRSSACILSAALEVIQQDEHRISKSLVPTHAIGTRPVLRKLTTSWAEAQWLVGEIKRVLALTGELMDLNDIAILLRSASLSRLIESALAKSGIAYRMVGGFKFYDRVEVKLLLDYLTVIGNPDSNDAITRVINVPSRKLGDTTVKALLEEAELAKVSLWKLILDSAQGRKSIKTKLTKPAEKGLESFVDLVLTAQQKISKSNSCPKELMDHVIKKLSLEDHLRKVYEDDFENRWANVEELLNQAAEYSQNPADQDEDFLPQVEGLEQTDLSSPLSKFLANIALASAVDVAENEKESKPQITISTIHAAKGLEWPVVFIPSAYNGSIPHSRAEDHDEERRLLYVAMTRAQALLYMSWPTKNSRSDKTTLSPYLSTTQITNCIEKRGPSLIKASLVESIAQILKRACPSRQSIDEATKDLENYEDDITQSSDEDDEGRSVASGNENWDGQPRFTKGQRPAKRQRVGEYGAKKDPLLTQAVMAPYGTTMGFSSASAHFKALNEASVNALIEKERPSYNKNKAGDEPAKLITKSKSKASTKASNSQGTLMSFFKPKGASTTNPEPVFPAPISRPATQSAFSVPKFQARTANKERVEEPIPLALSSHRLRVSSHPTRPQKVPQLLREGSSSNSSYSFLGPKSSPPHAGENESDHHIPPQQAPSAGAQSQTTHMEPVTTFHSTTTMQTTTLNSTTMTNMVNGVPRKSLGVRRTMTAWSSKPGAFKPPFS